MPSSATDSDFKTLSKEVDQFIGYFKLKRLFTRHWQSKLKVLHKLKDLLEGEGQSPVSQREFYEEMDQFYVSINNESNLKSEDKAEWLIYHCGDFSKVVQNCHEYFGYIYIKRKKIMCTCR